MKRIKLLITTIVLALVLASCGTDNNKNDASNTAAPTESQGVADDLGNAAKNVTDGVGDGMKDVGNAVKDTVK